MVFPSFQQNSAKAWYHITEKKIKKEENIVENEINHRTRNYDLVNISEKSSLNSYLCISVTLVEKKGQLKNFYSHTKQLSLLFQMLD